MPGGSSALNGLLYIRDQREDYDHWAALGNAGWSFAEILPYFNRAEDQERGADEYHGVGGPLRISDMRIRRPISDAFIDAAASVGLPRRDDFNGASQEGVGYFQLTMHEGLRFLLFRSGPLTMSASQVCAFARSDPTMDRPDLQFHIQPLSSDNPGHGLHSFSAFTSSVCQLRPQSRGHVRVRSADPYQHPAIVANYLSTPLDQQVTLAGIRLGRRIVPVPALRPVVRDEREPGWEVESNDELLQWIRDLATTIYHPVGTCRMGADRQAVTDCRLRVHGVDRLRVVDASVMPVITSGNTNAPTIMIGEKAADLIREHWRSRDRFLASVPQPPPDGRREPCLTKGDSPPPH